MEKMQKLVDELKVQLKEQYEDGEVYLNELPSDPFSQGFTNYIVTMHSPSKGTDKYLVTYKKDTKEANFIRIYGI